MRRTVLLFGLLAFCFSANMALAQDNGWPGGIACTDSTTLYFGNPDLLSPNLHPVSEGGTSSFAFSWDRIESSDFSHYYIFLFLEEPVIAPGNPEFDRFCSFKKYPVAQTDTMYDFTHDIEDAFGDQVEGRVWVSLHTRAFRSGGGYDYSPVTDTSFMTVFWDNTSPVFTEAGFAEGNGADAPLVAGTSNRYVFFRGIIDGNGEGDVGVGTACNDVLLPGKFTLVLDELDGLDFSGYDFLDPDSGAPSIILNSCDFSVALEIPPGANRERKNLTAHLQDFALNESDTISLALEYFEPRIAQAYPNPVNLREGVPVTIQVLGAVEASDSVQIFGPFGHLVKTLALETDGDMATASWDGKNGQGYQVSTGVYLYIIESNNGDPVTGKIAVVK